MPPLPGGEGIGEFCKNLTLYITTSRWERPTTMVFSPIIVPTPQIGWSLYGASPVAVLQYRLGRRLAQAASTERPRGR